MFHALILSLLLASSGVDPALSGRLFFNEGLRALKRADYSRAVQLLQRAIEFAPDSARAHFALADALALTGDLTGAARELAIGLGLDPQWPVTDYSRYGLFRDPGEFHEFMRQLEARCRAGPGPDCWLVYGYNCFHLGILEEAATALDEVLKGRPADPVATAYRRRLASRRAQAKVASTADGTRLPWTGEQDDATSTMVERAGSGREVEAVAGASSAVVLSPAASGISAAPPSGSGRASRVSGASGWDSPGTRPPGWAIPPDPSTYGKISKITGQARTQAVRGYVTKTGKVVKGYYRSRSK